MKRPLPRQPSDAPTQRERNAQRTFRSTGQLKPELILAVEQKEEAWVRSLLLHRADSDVRYEGRTPLMKAAEDDTTQLMELLIIAGADVNAATRRGRTCASLAAAPSFPHSYSSSLGALRLLMEVRADMLQADIAGNSPLEHASARGEEAAVRLLLQGDIKGKGKGVQIQPRFADGKGKGFGGKGGKGGTAGTPGSARIPGPLLLD